MIQIDRESLITLKEAAKHRPLGRNCKPLHISTVYRWIAKGVGGVRLEAIRFGGAFFTSREALQRFAEKLTLVNQPSAAVASFTLQEAAQIAGDELRAAGF